MTGSTDILLVEDNPNDIELALHALRQHRLGENVAVTRDGADARTRAIPVVALTSSREEVDIAESYGLGVNSYIVKPIDFDIYTETLHQIGAYWLGLNERAQAAP